MSDAPVDDPPALGWHCELVALYEQRYDHLVRLAADMAFVVPGPAG